MSDKSSFNPAGAAACACGCSGTSDTTEIKQHNHKKYLPLLLPGNLTQEGQRYLIGLQDDGNMLGTGLAKGKGEIPFS